MHHLKADGPFAWGYTSVTMEEETQATTRMDFGFLRLKAGEAYREQTSKESAFLLLGGAVSFVFSGQRVRTRRRSLFHENASCLHLPSGTPLEIIAHTDVELNITRTSGETEFAPTFYSAQETRSEERGKGTMSETSTRIVRTVFDHTNAPWANLVIGEVVNFPGKWSSYPPHYHPQPEIYHYRFLPDHGFGISVIGEEALVVTDHDTVKIIEGRVHPQTAAPGYAMYYIWAIRHLEGNPYIEPIFVPEHRWVMAENALIYPARRQDHE